MTYDKLGKAAVRFSVKYVRRRCRRQIRIGAGVAVGAIAIAAYLASPRRIPFNEEGIFRRYPELDGAAG